MSKNKYQYLIDWYEKSKFIAKKLIVEKKEYKEILNLTSFLDDKYSDISISQRMNHIRNNNFKYVSCKVCEKPLNYHNKNGLHGYSTVCNNIDCISPNRKMPDMVILHKHTKFDYKCFCSKCESEFIISVESYRTRKRRSKVICTNCNPADTKNKLIFTMIHRFLKSKFDEKNLKLVDNKSIIINNQFIIIFFIDKINANPKVYNPIDVINGSTAESIWESNNSYISNINPDNQFETIIIWESDWVNDGKLLRKNLLKILGK